ncbi:MAG: thioredoxin domain-containing protein [Thaumarchaeota archaeon]|nr:thioredoxin domain-containing protein [Nitrososphaerota archaeon]
MIITTENSRRIYIEITKTTIIIGLILLAVGYLIGNVIPITKYSQPSPEPNIITSTLGGDKLSKSSIPGSVNFEIPKFAKFQGSESATVYLVEFGDYQCPFCEKFFQQTEPQVTKEYIDSGKTKFYFLDYAIVGPDSLTLSEGAWCADEQGKYYEYHNYAYSHQGAENSGWGSIEKVKVFASDIGLDTQKFNACLDSKKYEPRIQQLYQLGQSLGITGTPTMFIGNEKVGFTKITGAQPYEVFQQVMGSYLQ